MLQWIRTIEQEQDQCVHALPWSDLCLYCYLHPQSSRGAMTWSLSAMFSCTSTWAHSLGRASRLRPKGRSMNGSVRRKCLHPLRFFVKDIHVSASCVFWGPGICNVMKLLLLLCCWFGLVGNIKVKIMQILHSTLGFVTFNADYTADVLLYLSPFLLLQPSSPHIWISAVRYVLMTSQITLTYASSSGIFSTVRVSPMIMSLIGTCWSL